MCEGKKRIIQTCDQPFPPSLSPLLLRPCSFPLLPTLPPPLPNFLPPPPTPLSSSFLLLVRLMPLFCVKCQKKGEDSSLSLSLSLSRTRTATHQTKQKNSKSSFFSLQITPEHKHLFSGTFLLPSFILYSVRPCTRFLPPPGRSEKAARRGRIVEQKKQKGYL